MNLPNLGHGFAQCLSLAFPLDQMRVEGDHEITSAGIVHIPQTEHYGLPSSLQETSHQSHEFVPGCYRVAAGGTPAQYDQFCGKLEVMQVVQAQVRVAEPDR